ncbi:hypothetical protein [Sphingorhabdus sp. YGSMI21]|uniref:hypothetical protein n=1 Tax=Sphingorhabdus sp. YGSMI21 TaxID=2077182 RepID=UPI000F4D6FB6|nr:hypothetical protein [Sphingorhabdus sp. YGSMI21]
MRVSQTLRHSAKSDSILQNAREGAKPRRNKAALPFAPSREKHSSAGRSAVRPEPVEGRVRATVLRQAQHERRVFDYPYKNIVLLPGKYNNIPATSVSKIHARKSAFLHRAGSLILATVRLFDILDTDERTSLSAHSRPKFAADPKVTLGAMLLIEKRRNFADLGQRSQKRKRRVAVKFAEEVP